MATGHDDDDDDDDDDDADDAHVDDDDDHLRVACYPRAPVSHVTLGRPCHMLSQGGRVTCYPGRPICDFAPSDEPMLLPVAALRFTHYTVNAELAFGEDHENCQASIFKLFDALFRAHLHPEELEVRTRTGSATLCCVGLAPFTRC